MTRGSTNAHALIAEPSNAVASTLRRFLEGAGYAVEVASTLDQARLLLGQRDFQVVLAGVSLSLDGTLLPAELARMSTPPRCVLLFPPEADEAEQVGAEVGADAVLVGPLKKATVVSTLRLLERLSTRERELARAQEAVVTAPGLSGPNPVGVSGLHALGPDLSFLKRLMLTEIKRSRRYRYPMAFLLLATDGQVARAGTPFLLEVSNITLRDVDVAVPSSQDRVLAFLPHTDEAGALRAAERLQEETQQRGLGITASIGVCAYEPGDKREPVSFGSMLEAAGRALREAQALGGNQVQVSARQMPSMPLA